MFKSHYTRKQAGVIYRNVKEGKLDMSKAAINSMYYWADMDCYADTAEANRLYEITAAVDAIFENDLEAAQAAIDAFSEYIAA